MPVSRSVFVLLGSVFWSVVAVPSLGAETEVQRNGTDTFMAASSGMLDLQAPGDVFASGGAVVTKGRVAGDAHAAGFDLDLKADVAGDLYAAGAAVTLRAPVDGDLTMMGFSLRTTGTAITKGNARLLGSTITIDGPVGGALTAAGGEITLNAAVTGDALLQGGSITFGSNARIAGSLTYWAPEPVTIPADVVPATRVVYYKTPPQADPFQTMRDWSESWPGRDMPALPSSFAIATTFFVTFGFLVLLGGALLALAPKRVETLRAAATQKPALMVLFGVLSIATLIGLAPVAIMTVIGLPFVPIAILLIPAVWTLGYVFGAYIVALRLFLAFGGRESAGLGLRILLLGCGVLAISLLNFVPVLGWMINFLLVLFGTGALSTGVLRALAERIRQGPVGRDLQQTVAVG